MQQTVRCKFRCNEVVKREAQPYNQPSYFTYAYKFSAVYSDTPENKKFFDATPFGGLEVGAFRDDLFMPGKEYYLDISEAIG
jgi:hypothetical protein